MVVAAITIGAISTGVQVYQGIQQQKNQKQQLAAQQAANAKAAADREKKMELESQEYNKANRIKPDVGGIESGIAARQGGGAGGTLLTGQQGVNPEELQLGSNTLLGG